MKNNGCNTHIVIKAEDAEKYLAQDNLTVLQDILAIIEAGREKDNKKPVNTYYICNTDEPYAELVHGIIIGGEAVKVKQGE